MLITKRLYLCFSGLILSVAAFAQDTEANKVAFPVQINSVVSVSTVDAIANVFTPNNDGLNDVFQITGVGLTNFTLSIYNRWGILVYDFISPDDAWDGYTTSGEPCSNGTYFYLFSANGVDGKSYKEKGTIQLFR